MIKAIQVRKGNIIKYEGQLYEVTKIEHITPGKGNALIQVDIRNLNSGKGKPIRFRPSESVEAIHFEAKPHQYMYNDGQIYFFMDLEDYNTIEISEEVISDYKYFLIENMEVGIAYHDAKPIHVDFPRFINLKVTHAEPWVKGDSVSNNTKPVELETGYNIKVPPFINQGDTIKIDTENGAYVERVN